MVFCYVVVNSWVARELIHDIRQDASWRETWFRHFSFLWKPSSVMIYTYRRYCINPGWMTDGDRSCEVKVRHEQRAGTFSIKVQWLNKIWCHAMIISDISTSQCPQRYVGQTGRCLEQCLVEHYRALRKGDMLASMVAQHVFVLGHQMDLSKAKIMDSHPHTQTRCLLGSWHIQREHAPLKREGHTARTLHHSAEVTMATNLCRLCMLRPPSY